jgi:hypothetical protein
VGITGKYNFPGIQKAGVAAIEVALASTSWGASLLANAVFKFFAPIEEALLEKAINWLANNGLIVINVGAIFLEGEFDQKNFDEKMDDALKRVEQGNLTDAEKKAIDDEVIKAFRRLAIVTKHN